MEKIVRIGRGDNGNVYCEISFKDGRLSITGVEGPKRDGNSIGDCGQIIIHDWDIKEFAPSWDDDKVNKFRIAWEEWHLNDMQAGSPAQMAWIKNNPLDHSYPKSWYEVYSDALSNAGLNPDPDYIHNGKPYKFGSAWLKKEVTEDVIAFLDSLPKTDKTPAWA